MNELNQQQTPESRPMLSRPWQLVTTDQVRKAIAGTRLEALVSVLESVATPALPLEITLPKALALAGTALSQPYCSDWEMEHQGGVPKTGADLLKLKIATANGQAANVWALIIGESGTGKDIGGLPQKLASQHDWLIASSGSAEGLKDEYAKKGNGLMIVSEFEPFLNARKWQYNCREFLTAAFNLGWFKEALSQAGSRRHPRESNFCYPSVLANIQPEAFASNADSNAISSGFLARFLISRVSNATAWRPSTEPRDMQAAVQVLAEYAAMGGVVTVPSGYLQDLLTEFEGHGAEIKPHYRRLVNEYGPRIAAMLAADPVAGIPEDCWSRAAVLIRWFYGMAEAVMATCSDSKSMQLEHRLAKYAASISKHGVVSRTEFSKWYSRGTTANQRWSDLRELEDRGVIHIERVGKQYLLRAA